jgi:aerobic carbon-monoxide dehydrogenase small subunit
LTRHLITLSVNGQERRAAVEPRLTLADFLRDRLGLVGTRLGCEHGACGACTVLLNGASARACITLAMQADGVEVTTIEGIASGETAHPLLRAFRESHSFQCGFCASGFIVEALALLRETPSPSEAEVREALSGNLCRCTGYTSIIRGVLLAAQRLRQGR